MDYFSNGEPEDFLVVFIGLRQRPVDVQHHQIHGLPAIEGHLAIFEVELFIFTMSGLPAITGPQILWMRLSLAWKRNKWQHFGKKWTSREIALVQI
jgi:hypothetical protein